MMSFLGLIWAIKPVPERVYDAYKTQIQNLKMNANKIQSEKS